MTHAKLWASLDKVDLIEIHCSPKNLMVIYVAIGDNCFAVT